MSSTVLITLQEAGFSVAVTPTGKLAVRPASKLTPELRVTIGMNRAELIRQLMGKAAANDTAAAPATAETSDWQTLDRTYQLHHVNCPTCIGAGKGYGLRCGTGAALWVAYDGAPRPQPKWGQQAT